MNWTEYVDAIYVINLSKRVDRLLQISEELCKWDIPYELVNGIEKENGAEGLRDTVVQILEKSVRLKHKNIVIFEDDCVFVDSGGNPNQVMNEVIKQLPKVWDIIYLGGQCTAGFKYRHSPNLIQVDKCFATHAWMISEQGMKNILASDLGYPIDNYIVDKIQVMQNCYITYPLLASQRAGDSDIGKAFVNWHPFIETRYYQKLSEQGI